MKYLLCFLIGLVVGVGGWLGWQVVHSDQETVVPQAVEMKEKPLQKYSIESLSRRQYTGGALHLTEKIKDDPVEAYKYEFMSDGKKVTGLVHMPGSCTAEKKCPIIIQFRGYADPAEYVSGYGTAHSAEEYAKAGFITIAPDFLGYGESDMPSADVWEARFETYTTALNLLDAVEHWDYLSADTKKIGIWGHSNGGQIALTALEVSGKEYPTVLWAPVSAPFPYSILFYMDKNGEGDRNLRQSLARFESEYDAADFDPNNHLGRIQAPIQLHQGTADLSIPVKWADGLVQQLKMKDKDVVYRIYQGANHNFLPISNWSLVVERDIEFIKNKLK